MVLSLLMHVSQIEHALSDLNGKLRKNLGNSRAPSTSTPTNFPSFSETSQAPSKLSNETRIAAHFPVDGADSNAFLRTNSWK